MGAVYFFFWWLKNMVWKRVVDMDRIVKALVLLIGTALVIGILVPALCEAWLAWGHLVWLVR